MNGVELESQSQRMNVWACPLEEMLGIYQFGGLNTF